MTNVSLRANIVRYFPFLMHRKYQNVSILVALVFLVLIITNYFVPRHYDYSSIPTKIFCDKKSYFDHKYIAFPQKTVKLRAGIGNQLFEIVSLLGMAKKLNRTPIFNSNDWHLMSNLDILETDFPQITNKIISIPIEAEQSTRYPFLETCCFYQYPSILDCEQAKFLVIDGFYYQLPKDCSKIQVPDFLQSFKYFSHIQDEVRSLLAPQNSMLRQKVLNRVNESENSIPKTCVHIRRGDFLTDGMHAGTNSTFAIKSIDFVRRKNGGVVHIFSNDETWVRQEIVKSLDKQRGVYIHSTPVDRAVEELIFSTIWCDSVLITAPSSTFGWWLGYLSKNQNKVYYRDIQEMDDDVKYEMIEQDFYPPQWIKIGLEQENGNIVLK